MTAIHAIVTGPAEPFWQAFVGAIHDLNSADLDDTAAIRAIHARMDAAEVGARATVAATPAGAAVPLWIALHHMVSSEKLEALIVTRDLAGLEAVEADMNWTQRLVVASLRSLAAQEGR